MSGDATIDMKTGQIDQSPLDPQVLLSDAALMIAVLVQKLGGGPIEVGPEEMAGAERTTVTVETPADNEKRIIRVHYHRKEDT